MKNKTLLKQILGGFSALLAAVVFLITFVDDKNIPTWRDIFGLYEEIDEEADIISFIDVGQGDCILIQSNGRFALIDTGEENNDIARTFKRKGIKGFDAVILSHWHYDHCEGFFEIADSFEIDNVIVSSTEPKDTDSKFPSEIIDICENDNINLHEAVSGMVINVGEIELTILFCDNTETDENNRSMIVMADCKGKKFLFTGDAETKIESKMLDMNLNVDCDVLKVAHHGSDTSSLKDFLKVCSPDYAVISVGKDNSYGHPHKETVSNLYSLGAQLYRTDYDGNVIFNISEEGIAITTQY